ncbi:MAG: DNA polymerase III subunit delta' [Myxococcaceae bacterium]
MGLADVVGQDRAVGLVRRALSGGHLAHAFLFSGPDGVGKTLAAYGFAQALLCPTVPGDGCGRCSTCQRVSRDTHPDVFVLASEEQRVARGTLARADLAGTPSRDIKVEQVRKLQARLVRRPLEASRQVALVLDAERLNVAAQNAFLKTLEEPPGDVVLVLVTSAPQRLLSTLHSRLAHVGFGALAQDVIATLLQKQGVEEALAQQAAALAEGSLGRAQRFSAPDIAERQATVVAFEEITSKDFRPVLRFAETYGDSREHAERTLSWLLLWNRDVAREQAVPTAGAPGGMGEGLLNLRRQVASKLSPTALVRRHELLESARAWVAERNASPRLAMEKMLLTGWGR